MCAGAVLEQHFPGKWSPNSVLSTQGAQVGPKRPPMDPIDCQRDPRGTQREPKGSPKATNEHPKGAQGSQREAKVDPKATKDGPTGPAIYSNSR